MHQQQPSTVTHSRISSLLIPRRLTRTRDALRYSVRIFQLFSLASYRSVASMVSSDKNYVYIEVLEVGAATQKSSGALCAPEAEPPF